MSGSAKQQKINHLCNIYDELQFPYSLKDISELSKGQLKKKIEEITGKKQYRWRAGDNNPL